MQISQGPMSKCGDRVTRCRFKTAHGNTLHNHNVTTTWLRRNAIFTQWWRHQSIHWRYVSPVEDTNLVTSSPPGAVYIYMRQWIGSALLQIMVCRLFGAKPLSEPMLEYCQFDPWQQASMKFQQKFNTFIHVNAYENIVCEMAAILSRGMSYWRSMTNICVDELGYHGFRWMTIQR